MILGIASQEKLRQYELSFSLLKTIIISNRLYFSLPRIMAGPVEVPAFCQNLERYTWNSPIYLTSLVIRHLLN